MSARLSKVTAIAGTGRSGTSFTAEVFHCAGVDPGGAYDPKVRAGWEYAPVVAINEEIRKIIERPQCAETERLLRGYDQRMQEALKGKKVVKDPRFGFLLDPWVHAGLIERVIVLVRPPAESVASNKAAGLKMKDWSDEKAHMAKWARMGYVAWVCDTHNIPRTAIRFPAIVREEGEDFHRLVAELRRLGVRKSRAIQAIREVRKPDRVRHTP